MPYLDRSIDIEVKSSGNLPHWHQAGKIQFVTFRLADSLPQSKIIELRKEFNRFKSSHPEPWDDSTTHLYWKSMGSIKERLIDRGYGDCLLKRPEIRGVLIKALEYGDGIDYRLIAYVVMPNHVHAVMQLLNESDLSKVLHSIKRYSAREINKACNRTGQVWMNESFDRIVRGPRHLAHCIDYIMNNPSAVNEGEFAIYVNYPLFHQLT